MTTQGYGACGGGCCPFRLPPETCPGTWKGHWASKFVALGGDLNSRRIVAASNTVDLERGLAQIYSGTDPDCDKFEAIDLLDAYSP